MYRTKKITAYDKTKGLDVTIPSAIGGTLVGAIASDTFDSTITSVTIDLPSKINGSASIPGQPWGATNAEVSYEQDTYYSITCNLTNVTGASANPTTIEVGGTATLTFNPNYGCKLPQSITVTGASFVYTRLTGTVVLSNPTGDITITITGEQQLSNPLCFTAKQASSAVTLNIYSEYEGLDFSYSTDGTTWTQFNPSDNTVWLYNVGDKVYYKGNNPNGITADVNNRTYFSFRGKIAASGNIMSLIDNGACNTTVIPNNYGFAGLFAQTPANASLIEAPILPATTLKEYCYYGMFMNCNGLTDAPILSAITLTQGCYYSMFSNCTSLAVAPALTATTLANSCYYGMFNSCTSLTTPPALPATTLADYCYQNMFGGCTSLTTAPTLSASVLKPYCYSGMFASCTSLTTPPVLASTSLATNCYEQMFAGCTALATACALPATTLATSCYSYMFSGCTSLTTACALPSNAAILGAYYRMFNGCTALYVSDSTVTGVAEQEWRIPTTGSFTTAMGKQEGIFANCAGTRASDTIDWNAGQPSIHYTQNTPVA